MSKGESLMLYLQEQTIAIFDKWCEQKKITFESEEDKQKELNLHFYMVCWAKLMKLTDEEFDKIVVRNEKMSTM